MSIDWLDSGSGNMLLGLSYRKCEMDTIVGNLKKEDVNELESLMSVYCLLLLLVDDGKFNNEYTVVFSDWDVGDVSL